MQEIWLQIYAGGQPVPGWLVQDEYQVNHVEVIMEQQGYDPTTISFDLAEMKRWKTAEIMRKAGDYLEFTYGRILINHAVAKRYGATILWPHGMTLREQAAWPAIRDNYARRDELLDQVDASTNWKACRDSIVWSPV